MEIANTAMINWVYNFADYQQMYDLNSTDLLQPIFDFPAGISSFNAEATQKGFQICSADPLYQLSEADVRAHAERIFQDTVASLKATPVRLQNPAEANLHHIIQRWKQAEELFLQDYAKGRVEKRYQPATLPSLPYQTHQFHIALCTDCLFYHAAIHSDLTQVVKELCRVAEEVRIFPLLDDQGKVSDELGPLMLFLQKQNFGVEVRQVPFQLLQGGNAMLRIWAHECHL